MTKIMSLRTQIKQDFIVAYKAREKEKSEALREIENAVKNVEIDTRKELSDEEVIAVLKKELKKREEAIEFYQKANRQELVAKESYEAEMIKNYLPEQMGEEEIGKIADEIISDLGGNVNFGQVMGMVMKKTAGNADGKLVAEIVKRKLA